MALACLCIVPVRAAANETPNNIIVTSPTSGVAPLDVAFDASQSVDPDGAIASMRWGFGDGGEATGQRVLHVYEEAGSYVATPTVTDSAGAAAEASIAVIVTERLIPLAAFSFSAGARPLELLLDAGRSRAKRSIVSYRWTFGDGGEYACVPSDVPGPSTTNPPEAHVWHVDAPVSSYRPVNLSSFSGYRAP